MNLFVGCIYTHDFIAKNAGVSVPCMHVSSWLTINTLTDNYKKNLLKCT